MYDTHHGAQATGAQRTYLCQRGLAAVGGALLMLLALIASTPALAGSPHLTMSAAEATAESVARERELERRLNEAREQLDDAARKLAELNREKYAIGPKKKRKAMLGILIDDNGRRGKLRLTGITPGGGAEEAGLKPGDRIVELNGISLDEDGTSPLGVLSREMKAVSPGEEVAVVYERGGDRYDVTIETRGHEKEVAATLRELERRFDMDLDLDGLEEGLAAAAQSVAMSAAALASSPGMSLSSNAKVINLTRDKPRLVELDAQLGGYFGVEEGVLVVDAPEGSGELRNGDVLLAIGDKPVDGVPVAQALLVAGGKEPQSARVLRKGREREIKLVGAGFSGSERIVRTIRVESTGDDVEIIVEDE